MAASSGDLPQVTAQELAEAVGLGQLAVSTRPEPTLGTRALPWDLDRGDTDPGHVRRSGV